MKVYIVICNWDYDRSEIVGVFSTREKAELRIEESKDGELIQGEWYPRYDSFSIMVEEVDMR